MRLTPAPRVTPDFAVRTRDARRVLVIQLGGLGDVAHSFPALRAIRAAYPQAHLAVMAPAHSCALLRLAPGVDEILTYDGGKVGLSRRMWRLMRKLRRGHYDLCINLTGSNHASLLAFASGAPVRLGRRPLEDHKRGWRHLHTALMEYPHLQEPMYRQWLHCLAQAGIEGRDEFEAELDEAARGAAGLTAAERKTYLHLSPCAGAPQRELPIAQVCALAERLHGEFPQYRLALSARDTERERTRMGAILARLSFTPWRVEIGTLSVDALAALVGDAALHLSGDTGPLHLAVLLGTPSVSWFRTNPTLAEYRPQGPQHRSFVVAGGAPDALHGIDNDAILQAARELLASVPSTAWAML
ncbi:MAG: glycosyltransferase family 9 protein [Sinobacteraceae bacterium]|nr:glycosyltransferase family 9 protein [Nevskiaceae bacterium]